MTKFNIYLHGENTPEAKIVEVNEKTKTQEIIDLYKQEFGIQENGTIHTFFEDTEDAELDEKNFKSRSHIHCHRCKKISIEVAYNSSIVSLSLPPSSTGQKILKKALKELTISDTDAAGLRLTLKDKTIIEATDHIGSYSSYPECSVSLFLSPERQVQG